jgi:hypothetical protein
LEPRHLLAGDLTSHDLTDAQAERLLSGLDSFAEIAAAVRTESQLQTPFSFLETADGNPQRLADVFQPEQRLREAVLEPLQDFLALEGEPASTQDWLNELQTYPGLTSAHVGIDPDGVLVLELEWSESFELTFDGIEIDSELD